MSVRDQLGNVGSGQVEQALVSFAYTLGVLALSMAAFALVSMFYVAWIEILHISGAIEQTSPMGMRAFEAIFELPIFAGLGAGITHVANKITDSQYSRKTAAGVAAGGYTVVTAVHLFLMRIGVVA